MSRQLNVTIHVPGQEEIALAFHVNLDIIVWSENSKANMRKLWSILTKRFPYRTICAESTTF